MRVSAKADYAVRAAVELALAQDAPSRPVKGDHVARVQSIPIKFLENILLDLRQAGLVNSRRGPDASLREVLEQVTLADVAHDTLPDHVLERTRGPGAWRRR